MRRASKVFVMGSTHWRESTQRRIFSWVGAFLEDYAQEAELPSDPTPYRREPSWEEDDRVFYQRRRPFR